ncbi:MAG: hypothetical protein COA42_10270 [Alteromonadaceae bacterium]|nr:MAG: hypothetical protein COA42_10270 [Alteromonadaceae bacterium]
MAHNFSKSINGGVSSSAQRQPIHAGCSYKLDRSAKLYLVEKTIKNHPFWGADKVSCYLKETKNVAIDVAECRELISKYNLFSIGSYMRIAAATVLAVMLVFWAQLPSLTGFLLGVFFFPFVFNLLIEANLARKVLTFYPEELVPDASCMHDALPSVAVVIPSCNEPFSVAKMTFDSAYLLSYPSHLKEIIVVDNSDNDFADFSRWKDYVESFQSQNGNVAESVKVTFIHRATRDGFKPQNLDVAIAAVDSECVLFLDIDSTLREDSLLRVVPQFELDETLGFIQLHTYPTNTTGGSILAMAQGISGYLQRLYLVMNTHGGFPLFFGHNAVWRTKAVRDIGSVLEEHNGEVVIAEDFSMSLRALQCGYQGKSAWVDSGEWVPVSMQETETMWLRWTAGTFQVFSKHVLSLKKMRLMNGFELAGCAQHMALQVNYGLIPIYIVLGLIFMWQPLMYLVAISMIPQLFKMLSICLTLSLGGMSMGGKIKQSLFALFVLTAFKTWVRCIGMLNYFSNRELGWKPTGKDCEDEVSWFDVFKFHYGKSLFAVGVLAYSGYLLSGGLDIINTVLVLICGFWSLNLLSAVVFFGRSRMKKSPEMAVQTDHIQNYKNYY